jgi:hypothetical protein
MRSVIRRIGAIGERTIVVVGVERCAADRLVVGTWRDPGVCFSCP